MRTAVAVIICLVGALSLQPSRAVNIPDMTKLSYECIQADSSKGNHIIFQLKGYCYEFTCTRSVDHDGMQNAKIHSKGCPGVVAVSPCTIVRTDESKGYPDCCPHKVCPGQQQQPQQQQQNQYMQPASSYPDQQNVYPQQQKPQYY